MELHIDLETYSSTNLKETGVYPYVEAPDHEILIVAVAQDNGPVVTWDALDGGPLDEIVCMVMDADRLVAHNAEFERVNMRASDLFPTDIPLDKWVCTQAMARRANVPPSLEACAEFLGCTMAKDAAGSSLIRTFSIPQKDGLRVMPGDDPDAFREFVAYCRQDVRTEQEIFTRLRSDFDRPEDNDVYHLDQRLNDRGIPINLDAVDKAICIRDRLSGPAVERFQDLTGRGTQCAECSGEGRVDGAKPLSKRCPKCLGSGVFDGLKPGQTIAVRDWLWLRGYPFDDLQSDTLDKAGADTSWAVVPEAAEVAHMKGTLSFAALKKLDAMERVSCRDGRVRGGHLYHGAGPGRWSGRGLQPQNFKRPTYKEVDSIYDMIKACDSDGLEEAYGDRALDAMSSSIRSFIDPADGTGFWQADYSAIEGRNVCWAAGDEVGVNDFRNYDAAPPEQKQEFDPYRVMAGRIFGINPQDTTDDHRFIGKQAVLGCGYSMGVLRFQETCEGFGHPIDLDLAEKAVYTFRDSRARVKAYWYEVEAAVIDAIGSIGAEFHTKGMCSFRCSYAGGVLFLFIKLPSGRRVAYPAPLVTRVTKQFKNPRSGELSEPRECNQISYYGKSQTSVQWGRTETYGGSLVETIVQGISADCMAHGLAETERRGYAPFMTVHDEALAPDTHGSLEDFCDALEALPEWAEGMPLAAEGQHMDYYRK
jgi:DNA polymerase